MLPPFVEISNENGVEVLGGFMPAMFETIAQWMKLNVTWMREPDDKYGTWENNTWTGMCGMLFREEVDIILNPLLPSAEFAEVAYYTNPVLYEAFTFLSGKEKQDGGLFLYFSVLEPSVWLSMAVALIGISLTSALLYKTIFDEERNTWIGSLGQYFWVYVAYMLRQSPHDKWMLRGDKSLLSFLVVLLVTVWVIGVSFLVMTVFQSLLVSKLTIIKSLPIIDSLEDFVSKTKVKGAVPVEIELHEVLKDSGIPLYEKAWEKMEKNLLTSDVVFSGPSYRKVERGEICIPHGQVFLRGVLNDYFKLHGRCDFHLSTNYFFPFPLLMGLRKSLPKKFQRKFDSGLSQLIASDISGKWLKTVFEGSRLCTSYTENTLEPIQLKNIFGVLLIWGVGMALSVCCFIAEVLHFKPNFHTQSDRTDITRRL